MTDADDIRTSRIDGPTEPLGPEVLAAFLDGTLSAEERQHVLERLVDDADARRVLFDASAAMHATATGEDLRDAAARRAGRPKAGRSWIPLSAAAVLVLASAAVLISLSRGDPYLLPVTAGAAIAATSWSPQRGGGDTAPHDRTAYRVGATIVRLRHAWAAGRPANVERAALSDLLSIPGSAAALSILDDSGQPVSGENRDDAAAELTTDLRSLLGDSPRFDLGIWTEQLRLTRSDGDDRIDAAGVRARQARALADRFEMLDTPNASELSRLLRSAADLLDGGDAAARSLAAVVDSIAAAGDGG